MSPRVSILMNCLNGARYLPAALSSVLKQTFGDWELIFWDDRSTDESAQIVRASADRRVRYFEGPGGQTLGASRQHAFERARGDLIAILDCDDEWLPEKLERQVELISRRPEVSMVYSDSYVIDAQGEVIGTFFDRVPPHRHDAFFELLSGRNFVPCLTVLIRKSALQLAGGFGRELRTSPDYELFLRLAKAAPMDYSTEQLGRYRVHGQNLTGRGSLATTREALQIIAEQSGPQCFSPAQRLAIKRRLAALYLKYLWQKAASPEGG